LTGISFSLITNVIGGTMQFRMSEHIQILLTFNHYETII